jgi:hypothetical protein
VGCHRTVAAAAGDAVSGDRGEPGRRAPDQSPTWTVMAAAGAAGAAGQPGAPGAPGTQGPQGPQWLQGSQGPQGPQGPAGSGGSSGLYTVPFSATPVFDAGQRSTLKLTLTGDVTSSTLANAAAGQIFSLIVCQDATGGHAFAPPANVQWSPIGSSLAGTCVAESFASVSFASENDSKGPWTHRPPASGS